MINLQLKSTQNETALADISHILRTLETDYEYKIRGHEIQQTKQVMATKTLEERVKMVSQFCARYELDYLAYHAPILDRGQNVWEEAWREKVRESLKLTLEEASKVKHETSIADDVIVVFHLTNYLHIDKLPKTIEEKLRLFVAAENTFLGLDLVPWSNDCVLALENTYPRYDADFANIGPFHPQELISMNRCGIRTVLDMSHFQLYINYLKYGIGNVMGDLDREKYKRAPSWEQCLEILGDSLVLLHISDAKGFTPDGEGLPLGQGEIPLLRVLKQAGYKRNIPGTLELNGGHLDNGKLQLEGAKWLIQHAKDTVSPQP